jgi:hypothetical protein
MDPQPEQYERQVAEGTVFLTATQLAPRIGYRGKKGIRKVIARAKIGDLPAVRQGRSFLFLWPQIRARLAPTNTRRGN